MHFVGYNSELTKRGRKSHNYFCWLCWHRRYFTRPHYTWFLIKSVIIDNGWNVRLSRLLYWFISSLVWVSAQKKRIKVWQGGEVWQWITQYGKIKGQYKSMLKKNLARVLLIPLEYLTVSSILFCVWYISLTTIFSCLLSDQKHWPGFSPMKINI